MILSGLEKTMSQFKCNLNLLKLNLVQVMRNIELLNELINTIVHAKGIGEVKIEFVNTLNKL
jgi:hypothetical protein